ncbi:MAG: TIGR02300 family protein [Marivibrio sp.]|uniref:TIGR02300 family protein n=1 Tax=Marivibrio sp. TaxID=2039719 RepID=UPI0032EBA259
MAKPEWGFKRTCLSCGAKFYDMKKDPIVCPKCEAVFDPDAATKLKRSRQAPEEKAAKPKKEVEAVEDDTLENDEDDDDSVLEDTSDLDDDPDVPGVGGDDDEET